MTVKLIRVWARDDRPWTILAVDRTHPGTGRVFDVASGDRAAAFRVLRAWLRIPAMGAGCASCDSLLAHYAPAMVGAVTEIL